MNPPDVAKLLALAAAYDQRTVGEADVLAWHELLTRTSLADAIEVVKSHYATQRDRLMPVDVIEGVRRIRGERIARHEHELVPPGDLDPEGYRKWLLESRAQIADGTWDPPDPPELDRGPFTPPPMFHTIPGEVDPS